MERRVSQLVQMKHLSGQGDFMWWAVEERKILQIIMTYDASEVEIITSNGEAVKDVRADEADDEANSTKS